MKKYLFLIFCLVVFSYPVLAQDQNSFANTTRNQAGNVLPNPVLQVQLSDSRNPAQKSIDEDDQTLYEYYGSEQSPDYQNRMEDNPNESNYDYDGAGGPE